MSDERDDQPTHATVRVNITATAPTRLRIQCSGDGRHWRDEESLRLWEGLSEEQRLAMAMLAVLRLAEEKAAGGDSAV